MKIPSRETTVPTNEPYLPPTQHVVLSDDELDARIRDSGAVKELLSSDAWQLILLAMRRRADSTYRSLAETRNLDDITQLQAWLRCYGDLTKNMYGFIEVAESLEVEKKRRIHYGLNRFIDKIRGKPNIVGG